MSEHQRKSLVRLKVTLGLFVGFLAAFGMSLSVNGVVDLILMLIFVVCSVYLMTIRCENCGTLAYRVKSKDHGFPNPLFFFPAMRCPVCGLERS